MVLEMDQVTLVDVEVVRFLNRCETEGVAARQLLTIHMRVDEERAEPKPRITETGD
jgi:hypothetical protein